MRSDCGTWYLEHCHEPLLCILYTVPGLGLGRSLLLETPAEVGLFTQAVTWSDAVAS